MSTSCPGSCRKVGSCQHGRGRQYPGSTDSFGHSAAWELPQHSPASDHHLDLSPQCARPKAGLSRFWSQHWALYRGCSFPAVCWQCPWQGCCCLWSLLSAESAPYRCPHIQRGCDGALGATSASSWEYEGVCREEHSGQCCTTVAAAHITSRAHVVSWGPRYTWATQPDCRWTPRLPGPLTE